MATLIKNILNRNIIEFDKGAFDTWCVYLTRQNQFRYAPKDTEYFAVLKRLGNIYNHKKIYNDFVTFYKLTNKNIDANVLHIITQLSKDYKQHAEEIDIWFTIIYAGMIAEENKAFTKLKKRIKRLGMHQVLIDDLSVDYAANFSKGKKWHELDAVMKEKGF